jgi:type IV pilus assembly protein PilC
MANYDYIIKTKKGKVRQGKIKAPSAAVVGEVLEKKGYLVVEVKEEKKSFGFNIPFIGGIRLKDKTIFIRQLATMLDAGISIDEALEVIISQTRNSRLIVVLKGIKKRVEGGSSLSKALAEYPSVFDEVFVVVISAGEESGNLPKIIGQLAEEMEKEEDFSAKFRAAMIYPVFILIVLVAVIGIMMVFVIPQLKDMFESSEMTLPWTTKILLGVSGFVAGYWWAILLAVIGIVVLLRYYFKTTNGQYLWSRTKLKIPVFNSLIENGSMVRFCRLISLLLGTGIPILRAIKLAGNSVDNLIYRDALKKAAEEVERGIPFSVPLEKSGVFPTIVPQMIRVGEQAGKVSEILNKLALYYQEESDSQIKSISSLVEPVVIIILGLGVGFVVFSIIIPIYQISLGVL